MNNRTRNKLKKNKGIKLRKGELWNCGYTLARIISGSLFQFRHLNKCSFPPSFSHENKGKDGMKEWNNVLDEMAYCFNEIAEDYPLCPDDKYPESKKMYFNRINNGKQLFIRYLEDLWD